MNVGVGYFIRSTVFDKIIRDRAYLEWLRDQPCIMTGIRSTDRESVVPAHIGTAGKGVKSSDDEALPIIDHLHQLGHSKGEVSMLRKHAPDWLIRAAFRAYAREFYRNYLRMKKGEG